MVSGSRAGSDTTSVLSGDAPTSVWSRVSDVPLEVVEARSAHSQERVDHVARVRECEGALRELDSALDTFSVSDSAPQTVNLWTHLASVRGRSSTIADSCKMQEPPLSPKSRMKFEQLRESLQTSRAEVEQARTRAFDVDCEESLASKSVHEREVRSMQHEQRASLLRERAAELQAESERLQNLSEELFPELSSLEARAVSDDRRVAHEHRVRSLHMQVTEAALQEVEFNAGAFLENIRNEEEEDAQKHAMTMRKIRAANARRLAIYEDEEHARRQDYLAQETQDAVRQADVRTAQIMASLRDQRAADGRRLAKSKEELQADLNRIVEEMRGRSMHEGEQEESYQETESKIQALRLEDARVRVSAARHSLRLSSAEHLLQELTLEDAPALAEAEEDAGRRYAWRCQLESHSQTLEQESAEHLEETICTESSVVCNIEALAAMVSEVVSVAADRHQEATLAATTARILSNQIAEGPCQQLAAAEMSLAARARDLEEWRRLSLEQASAQRNQANKRLSTLKQALAVHMELAGPCMV